MGGDIGTPTSNAQLLLDEPATLEEIAINNAPAFGFGLPDVAAKMAGLFRMRANPKDDLNYRLIKGANHGFSQVEIPGILGIPLETLQSLDTPDIIALYFSIKLRKGRNISMGGHTHGKRVSLLVNDGYKESGYGAANALRVMKNTNVGFLGHKNLYSPSIETRLDAQDENAKLQFMRAFFTPIFETPAFPSDYENIDSNEARDFYTHNFIQLVRQKSRRGNDFETTKFEGESIRSFTNPSSLYFVQRNIVLTPTGEIERYNCSCPHGYRRMYGGLSRNAPEECRHIKYFKNQLK